MAKFHFIVPVMSKVMAGEGHWSRTDGKDARNVEDVLHRNLSSLTNQVAIEDVRIHAVCHEVPILHVNPDRITTHIVNFPRPPDIDYETYLKLSGKHLDKLPGADRRKINDKYSKIRHGLAKALSDQEARWVMFVDHDDLIHRDVAAYALEHDGMSEGGHTVTRGYSYQVGENKFRRMGGFHKTCGSCNVIRLADWEKKMFEKTQDVLQFGYGKEGEPTHRKAHWLWAGHASTFQRLRNAGRDTSKLPFRAAVYVTNTGSNYSGTKKSGSGDEALTPELLAQFGMNGSAATEPQQTSASLNMSR